MNPSDFGMDSKQIAHRCENALFASDVHVKIGRSFFPCIFPQIIMIVMTRNYAKEERKKKRNKNDEIIIEKNKG